MNDWLFDSVGDGVSEGVNVIDVEGDRESVRSMVSEREVEGVLLSVPDGVCSSVGETDLVFVALSLIEGELVLPVGVTSEEKVSPAEGVTDPSDFVCVSDDVLATVAVCERVGERDTVGIDDTDRVSDGEKVRELLNVTVREGVNDGVWTAVSLFVLDRSAVGENDALSVPVSLFETDGSAVGENDGDLDKERVSDTLGEKDRDGVCVGGGVIVRVPVYSLEGVKESVNC